MAFETCGTKYDKILPNNNCERSITLQPTGMVFREYLSCDNREEKWTRIIYPNGAKFNVPLISWIPAKSYLNRMVAGGEEWRVCFDKCVANL
jgi:hypothetical protein